MQHTHQTSLQVFDPQRLPWVVDGLGSFRNNRVDVLSGRQVSLFADTQEGHPGRQRCPRIFVDTTSRSTSSLLQKGIRSCCLSGGNGPA